MSLVLIFFLLALTCFTLSLGGQISPKFNALALGFVFLTIALMLQSGTARAQDLTFEQAQSLQRQDMAAAGFKLRYVVETEMMYVYQYEHPSGILTDFSELRT